MLDDFLAKYRKGDIVYPSAVARYLGIAVEKAYKLLERRNDVCPIFVVQCPFCSHLVKRWYSIRDLPDDEEIGCEHCDTVFTKPKGWKLPPVGVQRKAATDLGSVSLPFIVCRIRVYLRSDHPFDIL